MNVRPLAASALLLLAAGAYFFFLRGWGVPPFAAGIAFGLTLAFGTARLARAPRAGPGRPATAAILVVALLAITLGYALLPLGRGGADMPAVGLGLVAGFLAHLLATGDPTERPAPT